MEVEIFDHELITLIRFNPLISGMGNGRLTTLRSPATGTMFQSAYQRHGEWKMRSAKLRKLAWPLSFNPLISGMGNGRVPLNWCQNRALAHCITLFRVYVNNPPNGTRRNGPSVQNALFVVISTRKNRAGSRWIALVRVRLHFPNGIRFILRFPPIR